MLGKMIVKHVPVFWRGEHYTAITMMGYIDAVLNRDGVNVEPKLTDLEFCEVQDIVNDYLGGRK